VPGAASRQGAGAPGDGIGSLRQEQKAAEFRSLHAGEAFVIPNPWDAGSARVFAALGFKALATTSSGFAITRVAEAGAVGASIEDYDPAGGLYELQDAVERVAAAVEAARALGFPFVLTARAENHIRGNPDLD